MTTEVDAARGQHRVVGPDGLAAWLADAEGAPAAFHVVASCPCRRSRTSVVIPVNESY